MRKLLKYLISWVGICLFLSLSFLPSHSQNNPKRIFVVKYNKADILGKDSKEGILKAKLHKWYVDGKIDSSAGHYRLYVPVKEVFVLPKYYNSDLVNNPKNVIPTDIAVWDDSSGESLSPDTLYYVEIEYSKRIKSKIHKAIKGYNLHDPYTVLSKGCRWGNTKSIRDAKARGLREKKRKMRGRIFKPHKIIRKGKGK